ncbi:glycosyltransferase family 2 protein [Kocuria rosea]|uniref:glycosyltransferase family 2 protein n=1 Tax=Kocuria rosea TaxID=1275 RepID=UPI00203CF51F|nr:glycosyltransferase family 2 protein [Kocuria rosea]
MSAQIPRTEVRIHASIILVTYNSAQLLDDSIGPLVGQPDMEIIVIDNNSSDDTIKVMSEKYPQVHLIRNPINAGFSKAVNKAAGIATGRTFILVNPDSVVTPGVLRALDAEVHKKNCRIAGPIIQQPSGRLSIHSAGRFPTLRAMVFHYFGISRLARWAPFLGGHYLIPRKKEKEVTKTDWVTGAVLAINANTWAEVGGLSERWFMYAEDIDLCWKVRSKGFDVHLMTRLKALHHVGSSDVTGSRIYKADWIINLFDFYRIRYKPSSATAITWCVSVSFGLWLRAIAYCAMSYVSNGKRKTMWYTEYRKFLFYAKSLLSETHKLSDSL